MSVKRIVTQLVTMVVIVVGVALGSATPTLACSCAMSEPIESFERADAVFIGEIIEVQRPGDSSFDERKAIYSFSVDTVYKGDVYERQSVVTHSDGATCGMEISASGPVLIFATTSSGGGPEPVEGELASTLCSGNRPFNGVDLVSGFGEGAEPISGASSFSEGASRGVPWVTIPLGLLLVVAAGSVLVTRQRRISRSTAR